MTFPLITAHTGNMGTEDNTLASVLAGLAHGADIVEDDIRTDRDGTLVLAHDEEVRLPGGRIGRLADLTLEELAERPTLLNEAIGPVLEAGKTMNLDVKTDSCLEPIAEWASKLGLYDRVFLTGCGYARAALANRIDPRLRKLLNVDADSFSRLPFAEATREACAAALNTGCYGLNVPYPLAMPSLLEYAADRGLPVYVWTIDDRQQLERFADLEVRSITTRDVAMLAEIKRNRSRER